MCLTFSNFSGAFMLKEISKEMFLAIFYRRFCHFSAFSHLLRTTQFRFIITISQLLQLRFSVHKLLNFDFPQFIVTVVEIEFIFIINIYNFSNFFIFHNSY